MKIQKTNRTLRTIIFSYVVVLLLPLLFGTMLYGIAISVLKTEVDQAQYQVLEHAEESVSHSIKAMDRIINTLCINSDIQALSERNSFTIEDFQRMQRVQNDLEIAAISNNYISNIIVYFHESDTVLDTNYYLSNIGKLDEELKILSMDRESFRYNIQQKNDLRFFIAPMESQKIPFVIRSNYQNTYGNKPSVTVFISLIPESIRGLIYTENSKTFLFDENLEYISAGYSEKSVVPPDIISAADNHKNYGEYHLIDCPSPLHSMRYIRLISNSTYREKISMMQFLLFGYVLVCLLLGVPLSASMIRRNYHPIQQIVSILPNVSSQKDEDDFRLIEKSLAGLIQQNQENEKIIDHQSNAMKNYLMYNLIHRGESFRQNFTEESRRLNIDFRDEGFLMLGIDIEDGSSLFFENTETINQEMFQLAFFAIGNILSGRIGNEYSFFLAESSGMMLALINFDERFDKDKLLSRMRYYGKDLVEKMETNFCVKLSLSISEPHHGFGGIRECYQEIQEIVEHRNDVKSSPILQYQQIKVDNFIAELEKSAISEIRRHAYDQAERLLKKAKQSEIIASEPPAEETVPEDSKSLSSILAYIDQHYTDSDLSVAAVAQEFGMTPSYLSLFFKRKMELSPLEYIHQKRISRAKILLESDLPIKEIAHQIGYFDTRPMIRYFKRTEGITPSEYREKINSQKHESKN